MQTNFSENKRCLFYAIGVSDYQTVVLQINICIQSDANTVFRKQKCFVGFNWRKRLSIKASCYQMNIYFRSNSSKHFIDKIQMK